MEELLESMTFRQLRLLEKRMDELFGKSNIDVDFTQHFKERVIKRNINEPELKSMLLKLYSMHRGEISRDEFKALVFDVSTFLNVPIDVEWKERKGQYELYLITAFNTKDKGKPGGGQGKPIIKV